MSRRLRRSTPAQGEGGAQAPGEGLRGDLRWGTIPRLVADSAERFGKAEALVDGSTRLTFRQLAESVKRAARAVIAAGVRPGDRVAIWAPNIGEWVQASLGALSAGAVLVPLNTRFKGDEAAYILEKSGAVALFTVTDFLGADYVEMIASRELPFLRSVVVLSGEAPEATSSWEAFLESGTSVTSRDADHRAAAVQPDDLSDIIFTSGTTGRPKGAMVTHAQSLRVFADWADIVGLGEGDRYLVVNPFFHTFGYKAGILAALMQGATIVPQAVFDVEEVLARVEAEGITMLPGPPTLFQSILDHPRRQAHDLATLRLAVTGAAIVPVQLITRMREELTFRTVLTGYGLSEASGTATICRHDDAPETVSLTSGRAIPGTEVRVVDDRGLELPHGSTGEVVVRGYNVMKGYLDEPEETAAAVDEHGWLRTGDVGVLDDRGYLTITDRKKDMFIVGGFNAYPAEIESVLLDHPEIAQVAVVGVPDERMGEVGVAFVVPRGGTAPTAEEIIAWSRERLANYKVPRRVEMVDSFPLNASGKVLKYELRERARPGPRAS